MVCIQTSIPVSESFHPLSPFLAWPPFIATPPVPLANLITGLEQSQWWPAEELAYGQQTQLLLLLAWAARSVPYYRNADWPAKKIEELKQSGERFWEVWRTLPVLSKADLRIHSLLINASEIPHLHLPVTKVTTSGSTGIPVEVGSTSISRLMWDALTVREHLWQRRDFTKRLGVTRYRYEADRTPLGQSLPTWGPPVADLYRTGPGSIIHVGYPLDVLVGWLRRFDPHYLLTFPSIAASLLDELGDPSAKPPSLEEIRFIAEPLDPALEDRMAKNWGLRSSEMYSANEAGYIAIRCREYGSLHIQSEAILVEIIDNAGKPCAVGELGRVVITPLHNLATPLIRYDLGDYAMLGAPCACGRGLPVIRKVLGRVRNLVRMPDGRQNWPVALGEIRDIAAIIQAQYVQTALDTIELRLVLRQALTETEHGLAVEHVRKALAYPFKVEIVSVKQIERGPTGKFEEFLSLLAD